eukprot:TRINITY_DN9089_c0_g2_i3.p1 TRINITY_DN9089_c0_g2~~TRINITY_DN9089_c0_g2_i3.p1  ORF type:complete len:263 (-),score=55.44 TRINITY_DN9089_c0_g2_i3:294-1082(-)
MPGGKAPFFFFKQKTAYEIGVRLVGSEMCIRDSINAEYMDLDNGIKFYDLYTQIIRNTKLIRAFYEMRIHFDTPDVPMPNFYEIDVDVNRMLESHFNAYHATNTARDNAANGDGPGSLGLSADRSMLNSSSAYPKLSLPLLASSQNMDGDYYGLRSYLVDLDDSPDKKEGEFFDGDYTKAGLNNSYGEERMAFGVDENGRSVKALSMQDVDIEMGASIRGGESYQKLPEITNNDQGVLAGSLLGQIGYILAWLIGLQFVRRW